MDCRSTGTCRQQRDTYHVRFDPGSSMRSWHEPRLFAARDHRSGHCWQTDAAHSQRRVGVQIESDAPACELALGLRCSPSLLVRGRGCARIIRFLRRQITLARSPRSRPSADSRPKRVYQPPKNLKRSVRSFGVQSTAIISASVPAHTRRVK